MSTVASMSTVVVGVEAVDAGPPTFIPVIAMLEASELCSISQPAANVPQSICVLARRVIRSTSLSR
jgi:hypothetical protein